MKNSILKSQQIDKLLGQQLDKALQGAIIEMIEEGYSEIDVRQYIQNKVKNALEFLEEYSAL